MVHLVECGPVAHLTLEGLHHRTHEAKVELDSLAAKPRAMLAHHGNRHLEVVERHNGLNTVGDELVDHGVVIGQALLVGLWIVAMREDTAPIHRDTQRLEAHFDK